MIKTARSPTWSARKPPSRGPPITPLIWAVESVLSAQPLRSRGTCEATSAMAFGMYPEVSPIIARRINSCQTLVAKAWSKMAIAIPSEARSSINLRPLRSARLPHIGDTIADTRNVTLNVRPDHIESASWEVTPSCDT